MIDVAGHVRRRRGHILMPRGHTVQGGGFTRPKMRKTLVPRLVTKGSDTTNKDNYPFGTIDLQPREELFVAVVQTATAANGPTFSGTFPGVLQLLRTVAVAATRISVYYCFTKVAISGTLQADFATGDVTTGCAWNLLAVGGVEPSGSNGANAVAQSQAAAGASGTTTTMTLSSALEHIDNLMIYFLTHGANEDLSTYGTGFTRYGNPDAKYATPNTALACAAAIGLATAAPTWATSVVPRYVVIEAKAGMA